MTTPLYNWERFWVPITNSIQLDDFGFLPNPYDKNTWYSNNLLTLTELLEHSCVILLAEPGMGKTISLKQEKNSLDKLVENKGNKTIWLDFGTIGESEDLNTDLFNTKIFRDWSDSNCDLYLFLDSFDEALLSREKLVNRFIKKISQCDIKRLKIYLACRTGHWDATLESGLKEIFGDDNITVMELTPLRRQDVIEALENNHIDSVRFLESVINKSLVPLATKPLTLNLLISIFKASGNLPITQTDLYEQGIEILCKEVEKSDFNYKYAHSKLSVHQQILLAGHIATLLLLSNHNSVWVGSNLEECPKDAIPYTALETNEFNRIEIRSLLSSGIFSAKGKFKLGWSHHSYGEFLASWYLLRSGLSVERTIKMISHPFGNENKSIPQFRGLLGWLSLQSDKIFEYVSVSEPEILFNLDLSQISNQHRGNLASNLLESFENERILSGPRRNYYKLKHPNLAKQIKPYLLSSKAIVRKTAIQIVEACDEQSLQYELLAELLDEKQHIALRISAASALSRLTNDNVTSELKSFLLSNHTKIDDEIKGYLLQKLWPNHLTPEELFDCLTKSKDGVIGVYYMFLQNLGKTLFLKDMPYALKWASVQSNKIRYNNFPSSSDL